MSFLEWTFKELLYVDHINHFIWAWIACGAFGAFYASYQYSKRKINPLRAYADEALTSLIGAPVVLILVSELAGSYYDKDGSFYWELWMTIATGAATYPLAITLIWAGFKIISIIKKRINKATNGNNT